MQHKKQAFYRPTTSDAANKGLFFVEAFYRQTTFDCNVGQKFMWDAKSEKIKGNNILKGEITIYVLKEVPPGKSKDAPE